MLTVLMWCFRARGGGRGLNTAGRSFENKLRVSFLFCGDTNKSCRDLLGIE